MIKGKKSSSQFLYRNITVSGLIGTGTTTLCKSLKQQLNWEYRDSGTLTREYVNKNKIDLNYATRRPDEFDKKVDDYVIENLKTRKKLILEGWLSGFMAQEIPEVLKVLLICSNDSIRVDRLINRDGITTSEAIKEIKTREMENIKKWKRLYGTSDFWNPKYYDLIIDTYSSSKEETLNTVLNKLKE